MGPCQACLRLCIFQSVVPKHLMCVSLHPECLCALGWGTFGCSCCLRWAVVVHAPGSLAAIRPPRAALRLTAPVLTCPPFPACCPCAGAGALLQLHPALGGLVRADQAAAPGPCPQSDQKGGRGWLPGSWIALSVCVQEECRGRGLGLKLLVGAEAMVRPTCTSAPLPAHVLHAIKRLAALPRVRT